MKTLPFLGLAIATWLSLSPSMARADEEDDLIATLQSGGSVPTRAEAFKRLRIVGTPKSVPALAAWLNDERLSQAARFALEAMRGPEATAALREAASKTTGMIKSGLIDSLGWRRDAESVAFLSASLLEVDDVVAGSSASALGRIGGAKALTSLNAARDRVPPGVARVVREALLQVAEGLIAAGDRQGAETIYQSLQAPTESGNIRQAAFAGSLHAAGDGIGARLHAWLSGSDPDALAAALQIAGESSTPGVNGMLAELIPTSSSAVQIGLVAALQRRGDVEAVPAIMMAARSTNTAVRLAAYSALGSLGDDSAVSLLLKDSTAEDPTLQLAARDALLVLPRGDVTAALVALVGKVAAPMEREAFRAIAARGEPAALPALLKLSRSENQDTCMRALQALGKVAEGRDIGALVELLADAKDDSTRDMVRGVFETLFERRRDTAGFDLNPIVRGLASGPDRLRHELLPVVVGFADARLVAVFRAVLKSGDLATRDAAAQALFAARDVVWVPDILELARQTSDAKVRSAAFQAVGRLTTDEAVTTPAAQRAEALATAYSMAASPGDKLTLLSAAALVPHRRSMEILGKAYAEDAAIKADVELASLLLSERMGGAEFDLVQATLGRLAAGTINPAVQTNAQALLRKLDSHWVCSGPFRQEGKEAQQLFDISFPPENAADGASGEWRRAPGNADPARVGEVDLAGVTGGNHCVVYARTRLHVPTARDAVLAIGSDDGIKLWLNGSLVHATNAVRGLTPGQDRANASLKAGWNEVFAKVTQHTAGCGFTLQVLGQDGVPMADVRIDVKGDPR